jgi:hypothetical protein
MKFCKANPCSNYKLLNSKYCQQHHEEMMAKWDLSKLDEKPEQKTTDNVNHPSHYGQGNIEAIEYISDFLTREEYQGYLRGNIAKYLHRWPYKNKLEDLKKASWYLDRLIKEMEN